MTLSNRHHLARCARGRRLADVALRALDAMPKYVAEFWIGEAIDAVLKVKTKFGGKRKMPEPKR